MLNIHSSVLQRQQYPHLLEAELVAKAHDWKKWDEKVKERREATYRDSLGQQRSVSDLLVVIFLHVCVCETDILTFQSYPSVAHTEHSGHIQQSENSIDADDRGRRQPAWTAWTALRKRIMF